MRFFVFKTVALAVAGILVPSKSALSESSATPAFKPVQSGAGRSPYNMPVNVPPNAVPAVPGNPLLPVPPPPEISDVPPAAPPAEEPPPSLNGLFDLSQLPGMPEDPFSAPGSSTHRYPQSEKPESQTPVEQFDYSLKTVVFYLPCSGKTGASCKRPLLTNLKDTMFKYDKNRNINISGIGNAKKQNEEAVSGTKGK